MLGITITPETHVRIETDDIAVTIKNIQAFKVQTEPQTNQQWLVYSFATECGHVNHGALPVNSITHLCWAEDHGHGHDKAETHKPTFTAYRGDGSEIQ